MIKQSSILLHTGSERVPARIAMWHIRTLALWFLVCASTAAWLFMRDWIRSVTPAFDTDLLMTLIY